MFDQKKYIREYNKDKYDLFSLRLPKGYKDKFKAIAAKEGLSMAAYIKKLVDENEIQFASSS